MKVNVADGELVVRLTVLGENEPPELTSVAGVTTNVPVIGVVSTPTVKLVEEVLTPPLEGPDNVTAVAPPVLTVSVTNPRPLDRVTNPVSVTSPPPDERVIFAMLDERYFWIDVDGAIDGDGHPVAHVTNFLRRHRRTGRKFHGARRAAQAGPRTRPGTRGLRSRRRRRPAGIARKRRGDEAARRLDQKFAPALIVVVLRRRAIAGRLDRRRHRHADLGIAALVHPRRHVGLRETRIRIARHFHRIVVRPVIGRASGKINRRTDGRIAAVVVMSEVVMHVTGRAIEEVYVALPNARYRVLDRRRGIELAIR